MSNSKSNVAFNVFMGNSPVWYKQALIFCLILNPIVLLMMGKTVTGWVILIEFIATLALALKCYPLIPGGIIAIEATFMGMIVPIDHGGGHGHEGGHHVPSIYGEVANNLEVILLLLFMVAGIHFMKDLLSWIFTKIIVGIRSKIMLSLTFSFVGAFLSAWLDALTVTAVMIAVAIAFYNVYTGASIDERVPDKSLPGDERKRLARKDFDNFSGFLRNLLMHGVVGTALGGVATQVGEPQNLIIASKMHWDFLEFYMAMARVSIPVLFGGLLTTILVEKFKIAGYGYELPVNVRAILEKSAEKMKEEMDAKKRWILIVQAIGGIWLIIGLAMHLAPVGLIGLSVIVFLTTLTGKTDENTIGYAFEEATPFTSLLVVFFAIVAMIEYNDLFKPIIDVAVQAKGPAQTYIFFFASGLLSAISDNVFVGTIYIKQAVAALGTESVQAKNVAIAINVGTNIPSIATPNGQAAFLFLLTNAIAARIKLSYFRMVIMALPYFVVMTGIATLFLLIDWLPF